MLKETYCKYLDFVIFSQIPGTLLKVVKMQAMGGLSLEE
jgi:hypothetical protein